MDGFQELREKLRKVILGEKDKISKVFPKLNLNDGNLSSFTKKVLSEAEYFRFSCRLSDEIESPEELREKYSDGRHFAVEDNKVIISIDDEKKLHDFLSASNEWVKDGSVELVI
ncbi:hypothetical protein KJA13_00320 [Patescibacteria group bacterium]|nr:hypothetical protein [Patescibacteria group bacterium]